MKYLKRKRLLNRKTGQKLLLAAALFILLWSRILSSVATIQEVQASFPNEAVRGEIRVPDIVLADNSVQDHVAVQQQVSGNKDLRLEELTERTRKIRRITAFYARWDAPLASKAEYILDISEKYGLDWRLIPAISIVESTGGRYCFRSYNAFCWGRMSFSSFEQAIETVARGLSTGYRTDNPYTIAYKYNPVTPESWGSKVSGLMSQI